MCFYKRLVILLSLGMLFGCAGKFTPSTPLETLKSYTIAIKKKDSTQMKMLLSDASIKMAEQEAKAQNITLDDVVKNETLFSESQRQLYFRNEKIAGEQATIEMKNSSDVWMTVPFVREEGVWKIDKQGFANQMMEQIEDENNKKINDIINRGRQP